jgi:hypothetical protein
MAWTKAKVIGVTIGALLFCGVTTVVVKKGWVAEAEAVAGDDPIAALRAQLAAAGGTSEQIENLVCVDNLKKIGAALSEGAAVPAARWP